MRKFFVCFLLLGVLIFTAQLAFAQLPEWITTSYPADDYLIQPIQAAAGSDLDDTIVDGKREMAKTIFQSANSFFNPRQKQAKHQWVPEAEQRLLEQQYITALNNLENLSDLNDMKAANSHLLAHFHQAVIQAPASTSGEYTLVNVKRREMMMAYVAREQRLRKDINVLLTKAAQAEAMNQQQALAAYLQAYPLFEQLKEAVLIQEAVKPPQDQDMAAVYRKLLETATGTNDGSLPMTFPEVHQRVNQLQNQGKIMGSVNEIAANIVQQLAIQTEKLGGQKGKIKIDRFTYRNSEQSMGQYGDLRAALIQQLKQDGWTILPPPKRGMKQIVSFHIQGTAWDHQGGEGGTLQASIHNLDTGAITASSTLDVTPDFARSLKPTSYAEIRENDITWQSQTISVTAQQRTLTGQELKFDAWTDQDVENPVYQKGELMTVYCNVNQPAYIRLIYVLADDEDQGTQYTLLHDSTHIGKDQVDTPVEIGKFVASPPFGTEQLIVLAQKEAFPSVKTVLKDGYYYLDAQNPGEAINILVPKKRGMRIRPPGFISINITTEE